ncbi:unnamed protein product [Moneuplotes crassus]|uniref:Uncharacterized protein n=1 Tax=Euplotes crassus TaxID=5936 RepID=A0AAD2CYI4_EUPCR|nr:unnamed protein product [Moneuplotes crassus]
MVTLLISISLCATCSNDSNPIDAVIPDLSNDNYRPYFEAFSYNGLSSLDAKAILPCSDYFCYFMVFEFQYSASIYVAVRKMAVNGTEEWIKMVKGTTHPDGSLYVSTTNELILTLDNASNCPILVLDGSTGEISRQTNISGLKNCRGIQLMPDSTQFYLYTEIDGISDFLHLVGVSNLTVIQNLQLFTITVPSFSILSYANNTSGQNDTYLFINSITTISNNRFSFWMADLTNDNIKWARSLNCTSACVYGSEISHVASLSTNKIVELIVENNEALIFTITLSTGELESQIEASNLMQTNVKACGMTYNENDSLHYALICYDEGFELYIYDSKIGSVIAARKMTDRKAQGIFSNGLFTYIIGTILNPNEIYVGRTLYYTIEQINPEMVLSTSTTPSVNSSYSYVSSTTIIYYYASSLTGVGSASLVSLGTYTPNASNVYGDIRFGNFSNNFVAYVQAGINSTIEISKPCSISGSTDITASVVSDSPPAWLSIDSTALDSLVVTCPPYDVSNTYDVQIDFSIGTSSISRYGTIHVYQCDNPNCQSCDYTNTAVCNDAPNNTESESTQAEAVQTTTVITSSVIVGSMALSTVNSLLAASSTQNFWMMFNQYQLFSLLPFLNAFYSVEFKDILNALDFLRFKWRTTAVESVQEVLDKIFNCKYSHPDENFRENRVTSGSFMINQTEPFMLLLLLIIVDILICLLFCGLKIPLITKLLSKIKNFFHFKAYFEFFKEVFLFVTFLSLEEIVRFFSAQEKPVSLVFAASCFIGMMLFMVMVFIKIKRGAKSSALKFQYDDFVFLLRRLLCIIIILVPIDQSIYLKLSIYSTVQLGGLLYMVIVRPFREAKMNLMMAINDTL